MVRTRIASPAQGTRFRTAACAFVLTLGIGVPGQAAAQATLAPLPPLPPLHALGGQLLAASVEPRASLLPGLDEEEDCDPALPELSGNNYTMLLAKVDVDGLSGLSAPRTARARPAAPVRSKAPEAAPAAIPAAAPAVVAAVAADGLRDWEIVVADKTLNATMARWAAAAGWQLLWELPVDYAVEARTQVRGTFEDAILAVARSMETAEIPMKAVFYQGNKVLRIMAKGSE